MKTITIPIYALADEHLDLLVQHLMAVRRDQAAEAEFTPDTILADAIEVLGAEIRARGGSEYVLNDDGSISRQELPVH